LGAWHGALCLGGSVVSMLRREEGRTRHEQRRQGSQPPERESCVAKFASGRQKWVASLQL